MGLRRISCSNISCSTCERTAANKDPWDQWDPCAKKYSCHSRYSCSKKSRVQTSRVPYVSAPPRTKIREIRVQKKIRFIRKIRVQKKYRVRSVCQKNIRVIRVIRVQKNLVFKHIVFPMWAHRREQRSVRSVCAPFQVDPCAKKYSFYSRNSCSKKI